MYGTMSQQAKPEKKRSSMFGPVVLIGLGVLLLLSNLDIIDLNFWQLLFRFWPAFLIGAGLDILVGRRAQGGSVIVLLVILGLIFGAIWLGYIDGSTPFGMVKGEPISQSVAGASRAEIVIESSMSQMRVGASTDALALIDGNIALHPNEELTRDFAVLGGTASYRLESGSRSLILPSFGRSEDGLWDLTLNRTLPMNLQISTGVGTSELDFRELNLVGLTVETGVGKADVTLPAFGVLDATVTGGVGGITIQIPATMAARIEAHAGIGSVRVDGDFIEEDGVYVSPGYVNAAHRVNLTVEGGIGAITIDELGDELR